MKFLCIFGPLPHVEGRGMDPKAKAAHTIKMVLAQESSENSYWSRLFDQVVARGPSEGKLLSLYHAGCWW